jgi:predicted nuclease of predicted toxin-antitoxin system
MRFLVDNALSFYLARILTEAGHDAVQLRDYGLQAADDRTILERAVIENRIIISADTDFSTMVSIQHIAAPSIILFRGSTAHKPERQADLVLANLRSVSDFLEAGAIVVFDENRIRIRKLPIS